MRANFKKKKHDIDLTLAQLWKARRVQEKLAKSDNQSPQLRRKEAA